MTREHCLAAGMDDDLAKPVRAAEIFAAIDRVVSTFGVPRPASRDDWDRARLLDPATLLASCGDDPEGLRAMCRDFRDYAPALLADVGDALRDGDTSRLRESAHKLCGLASAFSTSACDVASDLEDLAARGHLDAARSPVERLEAMTQELMHQLEGLSGESLRRRAATAGFRCGRTSALKTCGVPGTRIVSRSSSLRSITVQSRHGRSLDPIPVSRLAEPRARREPPPSCRRRR